MAHDAASRSKRMVDAIDAVIRASDAQEVRLVTAWPTRTPCWRDLAAMFRGLQFHTTDKLDGGRFVVQARRRSR